MLLINKQQLNPKQVAEKFNVPSTQLEKLKRHSVFDLSDDRKKMDMGTRKIKSGYGIG